MTISTKYYYGKNITKCEELWGSKFITAIVTQNVCNILKMKLFYPSYMNDYMKNRAFERDRFQKKNVK